jgi:hypothetical protein
VGCARSPRSENPGAARGEPRGSEVGTTERSIQHHIEHLQEIE